MMRSAYRSGCVSVGVAEGVVEEQGGGLLTAIRGSGGAEGACATCSHCTPGSGGKGGARVVFD